MSCLDWQLIRRVIYNVTYNYVWYSIKNDSKHQSTYTSVTVNRLIDSRSTSSNVSVANFGYKLTSLIQFYGRWHKAPELYMRQVRRKDTVTHKELSVAISRSVLLFVWYFFQLNDPVTIRGSPLFVSSQLLKSNVQMCNRVVLKL